MEGVREWEEVEADYKEDVDPTIDTDLLELEQLCRRWWNRVEQVYTGDQLWYLLRAVW